MGLGFNSKLLNYQRVYHVSIIWISHDISMIWVYIYTLYTHTIYIYVYINTYIMWGSGDISLFLNPIDYSYRYHKP